MPILKQLVSGSSQTKRRSRMDLTREMISAPLGDFRHTMHVGRGGDAFGDTSFLSSRSGEPPPDPDAFSRSPKPGLLSRTFRSSKRSQSVTRVDRENSLQPPGGSPTFVKNAMSLPFLCNDGDQCGGGGVPKSLSSSPLKQLVDPDGRPLNGAAGAQPALELDERSFGELMDLPGRMANYSGGMKHAESVMSFHVDLGPSMLGDILGVMEKEDDDLGFEEGEGRVSPPLSARGDGEDMEELGGEGEGEVVEGELVEVEVELGVGVGEDDRELQKALIPHPGSMDMEPQREGPYTPEPRAKHQHLDSCSVSSEGSAALEEQTACQAEGGSADHTDFSSPPADEGNFSSFMEEEDDEIRV